MVVPNCCVLPNCCPPTVVPQLLSPTVVSNCCLQLLPLLGDCNLDGEVTFLDINPFIAVLTSGNFLVQADCNQDGEVNFFDIASFIEILGLQSNN